MVLTESGRGLAGLDINREKQAANAGALHSGNAREGRTEVWCWLGSEKRRGSPQQGTVLLGEIKERAERSRPTAWGLFLPAALVVSAANGGDGKSSRMLSLRGRLQRGTGTWIRRESKKDSFSFLPKYLYIKRRAPERSHRESRRTQRRITSKEIPPKGCSSWRLEPVIRRKSALRLAAKKIGSLEQLRVLSFEPG